MLLQAERGYETISALMVRVEGWEKKGDRQILPIYGRQRVYVRV